MQISVLKSKIHRAIVTDANLDYEGSVSLDQGLMSMAGLFPNEKVDIYNINNGARFSTYAIAGGVGEVCLNGAAARQVCKGDRVIIVSYCFIEAEEALQWRPKVIMLGESNRDIQSSGVQK